VTGPSITLGRKSGSKPDFAGVGKLAAYVGIPAAAGRERRQQLLNMAGKARGKRKARLEKAAAQDVNNAELLYIHTNGSPARGIPKRPVLEPAVQADGNRESISAELAASTRASLHGDKNLAAAHMRRTALAGQNAARGWFTDAHNGWPPNTSATIAAKGSARPLIDTGALRGAIQGLVKED
jgi:hypothetical protein